MPFIDVTDVLLDPEIAGERFLVCRRQQIVNNFGEVTVVAQTFSIVGSIRATGDNNLITEEAYRAQNKSMRVVSVFRLRGVSRDGERRDFLPDIVIWHGVHFLVTRVEDYSSFGAGMTQADCMSLRFIDLPPEITPEMLLVPTPYNATIASPFPATQQLMPANPARVGFFVQCPETNSGPIYINEVGSSASDPAEYAVIQPGGTYPPPVENFPIITGAIEVAGNQDDLVVAREW